MSDLDSSQPRRSQREKRQVTYFPPDSQPKRKRSDALTEDEGESEPPDPEDEPGPGEDEEDTPKAKSTVKRKRKVKGPPQPKKPRVAKAPYGSTSAPRPRKTAARKGKQPAAEIGDFDAKKVAKDTKISANNPLFNAIMNPAAALQSTVEDFLESLERTPGPSLAELINCVLRACGCNESINEDEVVDYDGVVDKLDDFTELLKKDESPVYPLTSKLPVFKRFRKSLSEFLDRLIASAAELGTLYTSDMMPTLQTWIVAMSSSQLRSFRHTASVIALEMETALCDVAAAIEKEAEVIGRQREGERKRRASAVNKTKGESAREAELEKKAGEVRQRRSIMAEFLKEFVDGVFVHRYRDLDANIRAECVRAMGLWFKKYPAHFLDGAYLRYVGWVLSDADTHVRLDAVRALALAYEQTAYVGAAALQHFTERFKPRLVQMAVGDTELGVRVAVVQVLQAIDGHGLLEDEQRERLCLLVFDEETRVRKAVSGFVRGIWQEAVEERLIGKKSNPKTKQRAEVKALGMLLVKWGKALDKDIEDDTEDEDGPVVGENSTKRRRVNHVVSLLSAGQKGRTALAVEALWDEIEPVSDWETMLDVLLLDHSAAGDDSSSQGGSGDRTSTGVDEAWRLEESEEAVLLEMFVGILRKAKTDAAKDKKGEDEAASSDITRSLIKALPRLFVKHQTDERRIADVLVIPQLMNLDMYLEMRMMTAYSSLWEDVSKQFLSHSHPVVVANAVATIRHMLDATSLSNTNSTRIIELEEELASLLRDAIAGRDEIEVASFSEDEVMALAAICARLAALVGIRDITAWMDEDEGGKQSSAWDIISALAERGRLGYKEEELMVDHALQTLALHVIWKARHLSAAPEPSTEENRLTEELHAQRGSLMDKLLEFAIGTQSNTAEGVRRAAFQNLMHLYILFCPTVTIAPDGSQLPTAALPLTLDDETQYRCAGFVQAEIERYAEQLDALNTAPAEDESSLSELSEGDVPEEFAAQPKKSKGKRKARDKGQSAEPVTRSRSQLEEEYAFIGTMTTFLRAIRVGAVHFRHATVFLMHYGRLGSMFDLCSRTVVDILREEGMYKENGAEVVQVIVQALQDSFILLLEGVVRTEEHTLALAKSLAGALLIRGAQLAVVRRLDERFVVDIHTTLLTWLGKRLARYEGAKNKRGRERALLFFRALAPLLIGLDQRECQQIKAHLDQTLAQAKLEPLPTAKAWDAYRAYEKRLSGSKDKATTKRIRKGAKSIELITDTEGEAEASDAEKLNEDEVVRPKPRPRPRRATRAVDLVDDEERPLVSTPRTRPRPSLVQGAPKDVPEPETEPEALTPVSEALTPLSELGGMEDGDEEAAEPEDPPEKVTGAEQEEQQSTPLAPRKRALSDDEEAAPDEDEGEPATPEFKIRRKRVRH